MFPYTRKGKQIYFGGKLFKTYETEVIAKLALKELHGFTGDLRSKPMRNEIPGARYRPMDLRTDDEAIYMDNTKIALRDPSTTDSEWGVLTDLIDAVEEPLRQSVLFRKYKHTDI